MPATFVSGDRFGGAFTLLHPLGAGGAATVWLAREDALGREVAVKIPVLSDSVARERFLAEARALDAVRHPGVVPVLRYGTDNASKHPFFAMPVYPDTLSARLGREGRLPEEDVARLGLALVPALAALHAAGIAHRDLKPSNILLDTSGAPVLADPCGPGGGTPTWAAPEQLSGGEGGSSPPPVGSADWHALGLLLYRALVGALPPPRGILPPAVEPPRGALPRDLHPRPSRGWERLLVALLAPDPAKRLTDSDAILRDLRRLRRRARWRAGLRRRRRSLLFGCAAFVLASVAFVVAGRRVSAWVAEANERSERLREAIGNEERPLARLRSLLESAVTNPVPDADGIVRVPDGSVLIAEDVSKNPAPILLLDGGTVLLAPPREFLERLASSWRERADILRRTGNPEIRATLPPMPEWAEGTVFFPCPILVGERGGTLECYDEWNGVLFCVTNAVRRAPGVESAKLDCHGFSGLVLERETLDPGLTVGGVGSVADVLPDGGTDDRRWFDPDNPLRFPAAAQSP